MYARCVVDSSHSKQARCDVAGVFGVNAVEGVGLVGELEQLRSKTVRSGMVVGMSQHVLSVAFGPIRQYPMICCMTFIEQAWGMPPRITQSCLLRHLLLLILVPFSLDCD